MTTPTPIAELSSDEAFYALTHDPDAVLIDVRTNAEWNFVGVPDLSSIDKDVRLVEWIAYPTGAANPNFVAEATADLDPATPILLVCRSGARSLAAATALVENGFTNVTNVADGFEGDVDADGHRHGGWKDAAPWKQS